MKCLHYKATLHPNILKPKSKDRRREKEKELIIYNTVIENRNSQLPQILSSASTLHLGDDQEAAPI